MPTGFCDLSFELRDMIYEHALVREKPYFYIRARKPPLWRDKSDPDDYLEGCSTLGLLRVCKSVHLRCRVFFYARNTFNLEDKRYSRDVLLFLRQIGSVNASLIQSIHLRLPRFELFQDSGWDGIHECYADVVAAIADSCSSLRTVTLAEEKDPGGLPAWNGEHTLFSFEGVSCLIGTFDLSLRKIASLRGILVVLPVESRTPVFAQAKMEEHGWIIPVKPEKVNSCHGF